MSIKGTIVEGRGLAAKDSNGLSDPFCIIGPTDAAGDFFPAPESKDKKKKYKTKTKIIKKSLNPKWSFDFDMPLPASVKDWKHFKIEVWDWDQVGSNDFMGEYIFRDFSTNGQATEGWFKLAPRKGKKDEVKGDIFVKIHFTGAAAPPPKKDSSASVAAPPARADSAPINAPQVSAADKQKLRESVMIVSNKASVEIPADDFDYTQKLGSGAAGDVFLGMYKGKHEVAIKVLKKMEDAQQKEFRYEVNILSEVKHPNIVKFFGASFEPHVVMVMEYCGGGSLYGYLKNNDNPFTWKLFFKFAKEIISALHALHTRVPYILHRDFKTLNVLLTSDLTAKVCDFGLSRSDSTENLETMNKMRGTMAYCCPEIYHNVKFSPASDVYSYSVVIWEMVQRLLSGKYAAPFSEYKHIRMDFQIIVASSDPNQNLRPTIPDKTPEIIRQLITTGWNPDPTKRPPADAVLQLLEHAETNEYGPKQAEWDALITPK